MKKIIIFLFIFFSVCLFSSNEFMNKINYGVSYLESGDYGKAINYFKQAKSLSPDNPEVYYYLGEAYFRKGDIKSALRYYKEAIEREPRKPEYHYSLGFLYLAQNNIKKAIEEFDNVIKIAPQSFVGEKAKLIKSSIQKTLNQEKLASKWVKMEEEERRRKEEEKKKKEAEKGKPGETGPGPEGMIGPEGMPGAPGMPGMTEKEKKIPVEKLIKRIKYGTKTIKENSSAILPYYTSAEISKVYKDIMEIVEKEKNVDVRKNLIKALGKVNKPEVGEFILSIIQNEKTPFEIKIVALESIGGIKTKNVIVALRNTLDNMVKSREKERQEARKNIENINKQIDKLQVEKITLNSEINKLQQDKNNITNKMQAGMMAGPGMPPGMAPPPEAMGPAPGGEVKVLSKEEVQKLQSQLKNIEKQIESKKERLSKIDEEFQKLQEKRRRYQMLLAKKGGKVKISALTYGPQAPAPGMMPPGMEPEFMPGYMPQQQQKTSEEENEIIFAMKLIIALGEMGDKEALPVIKKAWKEFGVSNYRIYYALTLARLGNYSRIKLLLARLKQDYPQTQNKEEEIKLRADIIKVLGDYLKTNPDEELIGLISYLSEEGQFPEIKKVASNVIASLPKGK